jgi:hypothetical protein
MQKNVVSYHNPIDIVKKKIIDAGFDQIMQISSFSSEFALIIELTKVIIEKIKSNNIKIDNKIKIHHELINC